MVLLIIFIWVSFQNVVHIVNEYILPFLTISQYFLVTIIFVHYQEYYNSL